MNDVFTDTSTISRFVKDKRHIKKNHLTNVGYMITPDAFIYPKEEKEISMVHTDGISEDEKWEIGDNEVFKNTKQKSIGRADIIVKDIKNLPVKNITVQRDNLEFDRHVTVAALEIDKQIFAHRLSMISKAVKRS